MTANANFLPRAIKLIAFLSAIFVWEAHIETSLVNAAAPQSAPLIHQENLVYEGAFKLPHGAFGGSKFNWSDGVLTYYPPNNSLYIVGHDHQQMVAEVNIPTPAITAQDDDLPSATVIQPFYDASEGKMYTVDAGSIKVGGLLAFNNKLYGSAYSFYDANHSQTLSHFSSSLDLSIQGDAEGMFKVGDVMAGYVSGFMAHIPPEWQLLFGGPAITGNCCRSIITRTSFGPAAFVFNPSHVGQQSPVPATPLVYYTPSDPLGAWDGTNHLFNGNTTISGVAFPQNSRSVLFFGVHGIGTFCYGEAASCNDPVKPSKGNHAYPYVHQVWAYDALDLLKVKNGELSPWEIAPYQVWQLSLPFENEPVNPIGGTYDPSTKRLFISHPRKGDHLLIHVFKVSNLSTEIDTIPPSAPQGLILN